MKDPILLGALFAGITLVTLLLLHWTEHHNRVGYRIKSFFDEGYRPREVLLQESWSYRVLRPMLSVLAAWGSKMTPGRQRDQLIERLVQAGFYSPMAVRGFMAAKGIGMLIGIAVGLILMAQNVGLGLVVGGTMAIFSLYVPDIWLNQKILKRKETIVRSLPDVLDMITASVEAGLGLDAAILRITKQGSHTHYELLGEFDRYLADVRLGTSKVDAFTDLGWRCGVADLQAVVAALLQADSLGIGVGSALRVQSVHLRMKRRQRAQEAALQAPVKMLFPLVFFIFPAIFIVTLGPAVLRVIDTFAKMPH